MSLGIAIIVQTNDWVRRAIAEERVTGDRVGACLYDCLRRRRAVRDSFLAPRSAAAIASQEAKIRQEIRFGL